MTKIDVIKALECCSLSNEHQLEECGKCPLGEIPNTVCQNLLAYHVLQLIKEQEIELAKAKQEWISVKERLPEVDTDVLAITVNDSFKVARCNIYHNGTLVLWMTSDGLGEKEITHWMPLPKAPKMKGE